MDYFEILYRYLIKQRNRRLHSIGKDVHTCVTTCTNDTLDSILLDNESSDNEIIGIYSQANI